MALNKKHLAVFLTAFAFVLAQFIVETGIVYLLFNFLNSRAGLYFYKFFIYVGFFHFLITAILIIWARRFALRFYKEQ
jgi:hypothetical protein